MAAQHQSLADYQRRKLETADRLVERQIGELDARRAQEGDVRGLRESISSLESKFDRIQALLLSVVSKVTE